MTESNNMTSPEGAAIEQQARKQIVEGLISNKKKSSNKQDMAEFTKEWSKLAREEGVSDDAIGLLMDGFSIAGADPLFALMSTDESCLATLREMKKLPKIKENPSGISLRIYVHLFALSVNAGRNWNCINSIISMIPKYANNKEGKLFGTNSAMVSKYLLRELDTSKAPEVLKSADLQESTANKLITVFAPAFEEAMAKKKPSKIEVASVKTLKKWLESKITKIETTTAVSKPVSDALRSEKTAYPGKAGSDKTLGEPTTGTTESDVPFVGAEAMGKEPVTFNSVVAAIRKLERGCIVVESKLSSTESMLRTKEESIEKLKASLDEANNRIASLKEANSEKQQQVDNANQQIEKFQHEIQEARSTADARAEMITMIDKSRDQKESEVLARIASKLRADYGDFKEYEGDAMTVELGEIARLQLGQVFETLKSTGVKL